MKRLVSALLLTVLLLSLLGGCAEKPQEHYELAATTWPVYWFCTALCEGTSLRVTQLISEPVSCLHHYALSVDQMKRIAASDVLVCSGAGLEDFMQDALAGAAVIDASAEVDGLLSGEEGVDPHIWLSPRCAKTMVQTIASALCSRYPKEADTVTKNAARYADELDALQTYGEQTLQELSCRELITFHDGFAYLAQSFDLTVLAAIEEESGAEASAADLKRISALVKEHSIPAIFTEVSGSDAAAGIIQQETGCKCFALSTVLNGTEYLTAMRANIDILKEALQ